MGWSKNTVANLKVVFFNLFSLTAAIVFYNYCCCYFLSILSCFRNEFDTELRLLSADFSTANIVVHSDLRLLTCASDQDYHQYLFIFVQVNKFGVPCTQEGAVLGYFLGTIATNGTLAPVNFSRWDDKLMKPFYRKMLAIVEEKFEFPPETHKWVLQSINKKWRDHKFDLKSRNFLSNKTMEQIESSIPEGIVPSQWPTLVQSWFSESNQVNFYFFIFLFRFY
ncbi:uncharacterized protein LOC126672653 [Mercurialis annua]|uniref:uncharacterized protein LOC126672653 n=1 Tax=Mercurialis annua TaxID=3986 RepID=UPI0024AD5AED|nr:uncharacterized protein LOC126672653 [Mercurialis annua]